MPTFTHVDVEVETDNSRETLPTSVDFEVFCGWCNAGLCNQSDTRSSRNRRMPQVTVDPCERCLAREAEKAAEKAADKVREELEAHISELERKLEEAHSANAEAHRREVAHTVQPEVQFHCWVGDPQSPDVGVDVDVHKTPADMPGAEPKEIDRKWY